MTAEDCFAEAERLLSVRDRDPEMQALRTEIAIAYARLGNLKRARAAASKETTHEQ